MFCSALVDKETYSWLRQRCKLNSECSRHRSRQVFSDQGTVSTKSSQVANVHLFINPRQNCIERESLWWHVFARAEGPWTMLYILHLHSEGPAPGL